MHKPVTVRDASIPDAKAAVDRPRDKLKHVLGWDFKKANAKSEEVPQTKDGRLVHFVSSMDLCLLRHSKPAKHLQIDKVRAVGTEHRIHGAKNIRFANGNSKDFGNNFETS